MHCTKLSFIHPITKRDLIINSKIDDLHLKEETNPTWSTVNLKVLFQECKDYISKPNQAIQENTFRDSCPIENVMSVTVNV